MKTFGKLICIASFFIVLGLVITYFFSDELNTMFGVEIPYSVSINTVETTIESTTEIESGEPKNIIKINLKVGETFVISYISINESPTCERIFISDSSIASLETGLVGYEVKALKRGNIIVVQTFTSNNSSTQIVNEYLICVTS